LKKNKNIIEFQEEEEPEEEDIKDDMRLDPKKGTVVFLVD
jgi:hypothetical protein